MALYYIVPRYTAAQQLQLAAAKVQQQHTYDIDESADVVWVIQMTPEVDHKIAELFRELDVTASKAQTQCFLCRPTFLTACENANAH